MDPVILLLLGSITTEWVWLLIFTRFLDHTQRRTTVGRTPLNEKPLPDNKQQSQQTNIHAPRRAEDFYLPLKIRRLRPGSNPRTWVPKASTLPLDHRSRYLRFEARIVCASGIFFRMRAVCLAYCSPSFICTSYIWWRMQIVKLVLAHFSNSD